MERMLDMITIVLWAGSGCGGANVFGITMGIHPLMVLLLTIIGECLGALILSHIAHYIYEKFLYCSHRVAKVRELQGRMDDFFFALVGAFLIGGTLSAVLAVILGVKSKRFYIGLAIGIVLSCTAWNTLAVGGVDVFDLILRKLGLR